MTETLELNHSQTKQWETIKNFLTQISPDKFGYDGKHANQIILPTDDEKKYNSQYIDPNGVLIVSNTSFDTNREINNTNDSAYVKLREEIIALIKKEYEAAGFKEPKNIDDWFEAYGAWKFDGKSLAKSYLAVKVSKLKEFADLIDSIHGEVSQNLSVAVSPLEAVNTDIQRTSVLSGAELTFPNITLDMPSITLPAYRRYAFEDATPDASSRFSVAMLKRNSYIPNIKFEDITIPEIKIWAAQPDAGEPPKPRPKEKQEANTLPPPVINPPPLKMETINPRQNFLAENELSSTTQSKAEIPAAKAPAPTLIEKLATAALQEGVRQPDLHYKIDVNRGGGFTSGIHPDLLTKGKVEIDGLQHAFHKLNVSACSDVVIKANEAFNHPSKNMEICLGHCNTLQVNMTVEQLKQLRFEEDGGKLSISLNGRKLITSSPINFGILDEKGKLTHVVDGVKTRIILAAEQSKQLDAPINMRTASSLSQNANLPRLKGNASLGA